MRYSTPFLAAAGAIAGLAVSVVGYQLATAPVAARAGSAEPVAAVGRPVPAAPNRVVTRFAPCTPPAKLRHGVCVTHEWRTQVVYDPAPAPAPAPAAAPAPPGAGAVRATSGTRATGDDDGYGEQEHELEAEHEHEDD